MANDHIKLNTCDRLEIARLSAEIEVAIIMRCLLVALTLLASADAFGKKKAEKDGAAALRDQLDMEDEQMKMEANAMGGAREYEIENMERHRAGELNTAELGMANMQQALKDPSAMAEMAEMMKDPDNMRQVQAMMKDPAFQAQAKKMMANMPDMGKMMNDPAVKAKMQQMMQDPEMIQKAQAMAQAMGMGAGMGGGGMGGGAGGGGMDAEIARLRAENAALKNGYA